MLLANCTVTQRWNTKTWVVQSPWLRSESLWLGNLKNVVKLIVLTVIDELSSFFLTPIYLIFILNSAHRLPGKLVIAIACHFRAVTFISENVHNQHCFFVKTRLALHQRKICWLFITNACFPSIFVSVHRSSHAISTVEESQRSISGKQDEIWTLAWLKFFCSIYCADLQKILFLTVNGEEETLWT